MMNNKAAKHRIKEELSTRDWWWGQQIKGSPEIQ